MADIEQKSFGQRTIATIRRSRWPGWIWGIPFAALAIGVWLGVRAIATGGVNVTVTFDEGAGMQAGNTNVVYRGLKVGQLTSLTLAPDGTHVIAKLSIDKSVEKFLAAGTRFWLQGAEPSLSNLSSLKAIVAGPTIMLEPGTGKPQRHFIGMDHRPAILGPEGLLVDYTLSFDGPVGDLKVDAPVKLRGFTVGEVKSVGFYFDAKTGTIGTPVVIMLDPQKFHLRGAHAVKGNWEPALNEALDKMIGQGMRARMTQSPPFIGSYQITLDFIAGASSAHLDSTNGQVPAIPTQSIGSGSSIIEKVNDVPIDKIAGRILDITDHIDQIVSSPALHGSIVHLDQTLASLDKTARKAGPQITQLVRALNKTADQLDAASVAANRLLGGATGGENGSIQTAMVELTRTARSVRALADYLNRHPSALLTGR